MAVRARLAGLGWLEVLGWPVFTIAWRSSCVLVRRQIGFESKSLGRSGLVVLAGYPGGKSDSSQNPWGFLAAQHPAAAPICLAGLGSVKGWLAGWVWLRWLGCGWLAGLRCLAGLAGWLGWRCLAGLAGLAK